MALHGWTSRALRGWTSELLVPGLLLSSNHELVANDDVVRRQLVDALEVGDRHVEVACDARERIAGPNFVRLLT